MRHEKKAKALIRVIRSPKYTIHIAKEEKEENFVFSSPKLLIDNATCHLLLGRNYGGAIY